MTALSVTSTSSWEAASPLPASALDEARVAKLARRDVDADDQRIGVAARPGRSLPARFGEHPGSDRDDQAGLLGDRDEADRADGAAPWVLPAEKRFDRVNPARRQRDDRLEQHRELVSVDGVAERHLELQAIVGFGDHGRVEQLGARPAVRLRAVHRQVSRLEEGVAVVAQRHKPELEPVAVDLHGADDFFAGQRPLDGVEEGIHVPEDGVHRRADDPGRDAERFEAAAFGHGEHPIRVHGEQDHGGARDDGAQPRFALPEGLFGHFLLRRVAPD